MQQQKKRPTERPRESKYARKVRLQREAAARAPKSTEPAESPPSELQPLPQCVPEEAEIFHAKVEQPFVLMRTYAGKVIYLSKEVVPEELRDALKPHAKVIGDVSTVQSHSHSVRRHPPMLRVRAIHGPA